MPQIQIRPINSNDLPILKNIDHSYETTYVWQMERQIEENQVIIKFNEIRLPRSIQVEYPHLPQKMQSILSTASIILVAILNDVPTGYVVLQNQLIPNTTMISDLVVSKPLRRQGIATGLILAAQEWALQQHSRRSMIEMQSKNYPAIQLVTRLGFDFCGYQDHYYSNHDIALFFSRFLH